MSTPATTTNTQRVFSSAAVIGGTGEVGKHVVSALQSIPTMKRIVLVGRRSVDEVKSDPRVEQVVIHPFSINGLHSPQVVSALKGVDAALITLGQGRPSEVTKKDLIDVDVEYPTAFVHAAEEAKVPHCALLSSVGANADATSWFGTTNAGGGLYLKCKGIIEYVCKRAAFDTVSIFRPAAISENKNTGGPVTSWFLEKIDGILPETYKSTPASELARAMVWDAKLAVEGHPFKAEFPDSTYSSYKTVPTPPSLEGTPDPNRRPRVIPPGWKEDPSTRNTYLVPDIHKLVADYKKAGAFITPKVDTTPSTDATSSSSSSSSSSSTSTEGKSN